MKPSVRLSRLFREVVPHFSMPIPMRNLLFTSDLVAVVSAVVFFLG